MIINYQVQGQHHLAGVVSWGFGCALVRVVTICSLRFFSPKIGVSWGKTIIVGENLQFGRGERRQPFSERGRHSFTDTNTL